MELEPHAGLRVRSLAAAASMVTRSGRLTIWGGRPHPTTALSPRSGLVLCSRRFTMAYAMGYSLPPSGRNSTRSRHEWRSLVYYEGTQWLQPTVLDGSAVAIASLAGPPSTQSATDRWHRIQPKFAHAILELYVGADYDPGIGDIHELLARYEPHPGVHLEYAFSTNTRGRMLLKQLSR